MPERGEVWQVDFGIAQKVRPALVISIPPMVKRTAPSST